MNAADDYPHLSQWPHQFLLRELTRTRLRPGAARHESPATSSPHEISNLGSPSRLKPRTWVRLSNRQMPHGERSGA
jgi:hypothetical protein